MPHILITGTPDFQKRYMLTSTPRMEFIIRGEKITLTISPHPVTIPHDEVELDIKLNDELSFEAKRTMLKVRPNISSFSCEPMILIF